MNRACRRCRQSARRQQTVPGTASGHTGVWRPGRTGPGSAGNAHPAARRQMRGSRPAGAVSRSLRPGRLMPGGAERRTGLRVWLCLVLLGLLLPLLSACSSSADEPRGLTVQLAFSPGHMLLTNGNDYVWRGVMLTLNEKYVLRTEVLPRGASALPLSEFRSSGGQAFDAGETPHSLTVEVQEGLSSTPAMWSW